MKKKLHKDVLVGESNGYKFELYPTKRKNGPEHNPPHLHAFHQGREGKFCICNSYKGKVGDMYDGVMTAKEQAFVKAWIIHYKSKLNRRWRSQNLTRVDSSFTRDNNIIQSMIAELSQLERKLKSLKLVLRKLCQDTNK